MRRPRGFFRAARSAKIRGMSTPNAPAQHIVAVIGGATAGAEVASRLSEAGIRVVVFEMNPRPFGKIEDGLPRWHHGLRHKEYETIGEKLAQAGVEYVPNTKIGRDVSFEALAREWGFSAVILANGAWRDRPLPVEGADQYVGKGLIYQNPFIIWFNHCEEKDYAGERFVPEDGALVVGGGLASIDVVKVHMLETTRAKLRARGIEQDMIELEVKGIPKSLEKHGIKWEELGLAGCTLFYRRRAEDMPLAEIPDDADEKRKEKILGARRRLLEKAQEKYGFRVEALAAPESLLVENGRVVGLRLRRTKFENGKLVSTGELFERRGPYVISSIGSIPEPIPEIATKGELFAFTDWEIGRLAGYPSVFSVGNVVTGKGNIVASRKHAAEVYEVALASFLGVSGDGHQAEAALASGAAAAAGAQAAKIAAEIGRAAPPSAATALAILARVHERQRAVGYTGDVKSWLERVTPVDFS
jgi:NADPH-dependent glutamate synthase beta subunit-like oxidoreductase